jgi:hypothetical protein
MDLWAGIRRPSLALRAVTGCPKKAAGGSMCCTDRQRQLPS